MPQSLSAVYLHLVFSTKLRRAFLQNKDTRDELHAYMASISREIDCPALLIGGVEDHVHILARLGRTLSQAEWVKEIKRLSTLWLKKHKSGFHDFQWQNGYAMFSVSQSNVEEVREYIARQEEHHRKESFKFQDELRGLLRKHQLEWDERYVWD